ncbi:1-hydroxycarotenoid 3,4-desaturase [Rubricella aquisinus]|uniref:1-hydroxycarotenoid 3,4-desaturase n=1 Tax=Rubricella aquisinus TaxID=2028108 RepID=A0A840WV30_9RHOB|nr:1-hydroxycarotenoid 3,4-desaturase [Rubricella aquisinus]
MAALELSHAGYDVQVYERHAGPGGKMRTVPSDAGPVDAGPTVFTMRPVFEALFDRVGLSLDAELTLTPCDVLARHHWPDGSTLDLFADPRASEEAVAAFAGGTEAQRFAAFTKRANLLFDAFDAPVMRHPTPTALSVTRAVAPRAAELLPAMAPLSTLWSALGRQFTDPRLRQLFGRYATYVGGSPLLSPAILMLIWASEQRGVWRVTGGMHQLALTLERLARAQGATFHYHSGVARVATAQGAISGLSLETGQTVRASKVLFNGDPAALGAGLLGPEGAGAAPSLRAKDRALSAWVWTWASEVSGFPLSHHTVFFGRSSVDEFSDLFQHRRTPRDPTLYICAQDRPGATGAERLQIIMNAPADGDHHIPSQQEKEQCQTIVSQKLAEAGLTLSTSPTGLTTPDRFASLFPGTGGALYGAHPHGPLKTFSRPTARSRIRGLYLAGGGCHPGPGVPMAALSGRHAAAAIMADHALTSASIPMATPGGISTGSATMAATASRSSVS